MFTKDFWKGAIERAVKTFVQTLAALLVVNGTTDILNADWGQALWVAGGAAVASLITSIANTDFVAGKENVVQVPVPDTSVGEGTVPDTATVDADEPVDTEVDDDTDTSYDAPDPVATPA